MGHRTADLGLKCWQGMGTPTRRGRVIACAGQGEHFLTVSLSPRPTSDLSCALDYQDRGDRTQQFLDVLTSVLMDQHLNLTGDLLPVLRMSPHLPGQVLVAPGNAHEEMTIAAISGGASQQPTAKLRACRKHVEVCFDSKQIECRPKIVKVLRDQDASPPQRPQWVRDIITFVVRYIWEWLAGALDQEES